MPKDPQFLYLVLILPTLFGLTLLGEGFYKVVHEERQGLINLVFGVIFLGVAIFGFLFFSPYLDKAV